METEKKKPGRKPKGRDEFLAKQIEQLAQFGLPHEQIAVVAGMAKHTLYKYYADELHKGAARANLKVARCLFQKATEDGDTAALIFWAKTRMRWRENAPEEAAEQTVPAVRVKVEDAGKKPAKAKAEEAGADA